MKIFIITFVATLLASCETSKRPDVFFKEKFPDHNRDLSKGLPDTFKVKYGTDTSNFAVFYTKETGINYIIDTDKKDTLFEGFVAKYNGMYFLSRMKNDSTFYIHALHTDGYTVKGLHTEPIQLKMVENGVKNELSSLIVDKSDQRIILTPKKAILYPYFKHLLSKFRGDTILHYDLHMKRKDLE